MEEKRKFKRIRINLLGLYMIQDFSKLDSDEIHSVELPTSVDLSIGGVKIISSQNLPLGADVKLTLPIFSLRRPVEMMGKVVWTNQVKETGNYQIGFQFNDFLSNDRIAIENFINNYENNRSKENE